MTFAPRAGAGPLFRLGAGVIATVVLLAALALPAAADGGPARLSHASFSPDRGTTATTFTFTVTYRHRAGSPPDHVTVIIGGAIHEMVADGGDQWKKGVTFSYQTTLPAGEHGVVFVAVDGDGPAATRVAGRITVEPAIAQEPDPTPDPTPAPTPEATPVPGADPTPAPIPEAKPDPTPDPTPVLTAPKPKPTPTPARTAAPRPGPTPTPPPPAAVVDPTASPDPNPAAAGPDVPAPPTGAAPSDGAPPAGPAPPPDGAAPDDRGSGETVAGLPASWGQLTHYLEALGLDPAGSPFLRLIPVMIWSSGGVALVMAFGFFGKRRRDGEPPEPDEVLSAKAARGTGEAATAALVPVAATPPIDAEMAMPRWRRPSLIAARKADPLRSAGTAARLSFEHAAIAPIEGYERRLIRYLAVRLLDTPDEFRGADIGTLAQGDEVQLLERSGTYWRVLCPDGQQGWIHRMTLGDTLGVPPSPSARQTWATASLEAEEVDEDVLMAFMTARGRA